jgi:hypothetical protein
MRRWIGPLALLAAMLGVAWAALARTRPDATCQLPMGIPIACPPQANCDQYGATCDTAATVCVCPMANDAGATDAATNPDSGGGGSGGSGGSGGGSGSAAPGGGGQTGPQRTGGCSFVP